MMAQPQGAVNTSMAQPQGAVNTSMAHSDLLESFLSNQVPISRCRSESNGSNRSTLRPVRNGATGVSQQPSDDEYHHLANALHEGELDRMRTRLRLCNQERLHLESQIDSVGVASALILGKMRVIKHELDVHDRTEALQMEAVNQRYARLLPPKPLSIMAQPPLTLSRPSNHNSIRYTDRA